MLKGEAKVRYQREYMRRKRAGLPTGKPKPPSPSTVRLTQLDGKLPNLALMKLAYHHRQRGDVIVFTKDVRRAPREPAYSHVYGSAIFAFSAERVAEFKANFSDAVVGGTWNVLDNTTVETALGLGEDNEQYDYSIYPGFTGSIGFTQRGCRLRCGFCVVPKKEGRPRAVNTIASIARRTLSQTSAPLG